MKVELKTLSAEEVTIKKFRYLLCISFGRANEEARFRPGKKEAFPGNCLHSRACHMKMDGVTAMIMGEGEGGLCVQYTGMLDSHVGKRGGG